MKLRLYRTDIFIGFEAVALMSAVIVIDTSGKILMCFIAAVIHECGHLITMRFFGSAPEEIHLRLFDVAIISKKKHSFAPELLITVSGVLMNFIFAAICFGFSPVLALSNFAIGCFNLLPVETLDGGQALSLLLSRRFSQEASEKAVRIISFVFLVPVLTLGITVLFYSKYNYSLLAIGVYFAAVLFMK